MHDAAKGRIAIFGLQNVSHILIGGARVNNQGQATFLSGFNMRAQRLLLDVGTLGSIVVIQPGFTDGDKLGMCRQSKQLFDFGQGFFVCIHRMGAGRIEDGRVHFGDGAHLRFLAQTCSNRHHAVHAGLGGPRDDLVQLAFKIWKIKMAMAVGQFWRCDHERPFSRKIFDAVSSIFNPISKISELGSRFAIFPCRAL